MYLTGRPPWCPTLIKRIRGHEVARLRVLSRRGKQAEREECEKGVPEVPRNPVGDDPSLVPTRPASHPSPEADGPLPEPPARRCSNSVLDLSASTPLLQAHGTLEPPTARDDLPAVEGLCVATLGVRLSIPRRRMRARKRSSVNQCFRCCEPAKCFVEQVVLCGLTSSASESGDEDVRGPKSPSYFGTSYSRMRWSRNVFHVSSQTSR